MRGGFLKLNDDSGQYAFGCKVLVTFEDGESRTVDVESASYSYAEVFEKILDRQDLKNKKIVELNFQAY